jgi:hypothetical protein
MRSCCETLSDPRSLLEALRGSLVCVRGQEEVVVRILSSQGMKADLAFRQVDVGADQAISPDGTDVERVSQHFRLSLGIGFSDVDDGPFQRLLQVQTPVLGEGLARRSIFDAHCVALSMRDPGIGNATTPPLASGG